MASHPVFDRDETRTFTREYISENIWNVEFTKMSQNESQFTSPWCNRSSSIVSSRGITSLRSLANEQGTPIYSAVQSRGYGLPAVRSSYFPRGNNRANYEATRTRFPSSSIYLLRAISGAAKWIGRKFAAELAGVLSPRDPSIHASGDSIDHEKYRRSLDKRSVEVATAWNTWELSESVHRERRCSLAFITVTVWNSLADSLRRSCCINTTEDRGDLFSRDLCALSLLASQIAPRRSSQRSREYFRENSRLAAASSRGLVNGDGSRSFALRRMIISSLVPEIGRSVAQGAAASSRRSAAPFDEHWAAILRQPGCVDVEKTRTRTLFFALSLSLSLRHPSALAPWPRAAPRRAVPRHTRPSFSDRLPRAAYPLAHARYPQLPSVLLPLDLILSHAPSPRLTTPTATARPPDAASCLSAPPLCAGFRRTRETLYLPSTPSPPFPLLPYSFSHFPKETKGERSGGKGKNEIDKETSARRRGCCSQEGVKERGGIL